jgi:type VI secretion system secreted protein VgrG
VPFRPQRRTPKPVVHGVQTAVVVGVAGEEIDTDKYGRVRVQFHWDREGKKDQNSSCWVRVASMWAGKQWGMIHIPRIGQEVVVAFLEGDPDQPIIVGSVYNAEQMPPWKLPDNKTQSGIVTRSSLKGTAENYNEICFEDKKGEELLYVRAEKDHKLAVENDQTDWVGNNRWTEVDNKETLIIDKGDREETLNEGNDKLTIKKGNREATIEMGNDTLTIKMGNQTTKLNLGMSQTEAMQSIELKVGQSSLKVDQMGVTIKGLMINIEGQVQTQVKGVMTQVQGTAMLQAGGGIMMLG